MAASPRYKVYDADGEYMAAVKEVEAGALLMSLYGKGATIRDGHHMIVWTEGAEGQPAIESYDFVAIMASRHTDEYRARRMGPRMARALAIVEGR